MVLARIHLAHILLAEDESSKAQLLPVFGGIGTAEGYWRVAAALEGGAREKCSAAKSAQGWLTREQPAARLLHFSFRLLYV